MTRVCIRSSSEALTLYFYDELLPAARAEFDAHLNACADCRAALGELQVVRETLADRERPERSAGEWAAFMRRLDAALDAPAVDGTHAAPGTWHAAPAQHVAPRTSRLRPLAIAATLLLAVALGVAWQVQHTRVPTAGVPQASPPAGTSTTPATPAADEALRAAATKHFERAKLVVLGLAMKDPANARPGDWEHERELAASLLPDTRLYRQFAMSAGDARLSDVLSDLETVLLQASMTADADSPDLQRLQRMIRRRDLLERMDTGSARAAASLRGI